MRLLITGASGFLGRNMLLALPRDWEIIAPYRPENATLPAFVARHHLDQVRLVACDLTDGAQVAEAARRSGGVCDSCLYLASNTSIPDSIRDPVYDLTTNVVGLLHTLQSWTCDHLVYLSSGAVYVGLQGLVNPESPVAPDLPYAVSKLAAEHYIRTLMRHRGTPVRATVVRFFGAYGPYEPARKIYTRLVRRFAFERDPRFKIIGDGANLIDAMYVDDAVLALRTVLDAPPQEGLRITDLGVGGGETVNQLVTRAAHTFGIEPEISHVDSAPEYITFRIDPAAFASIYGVTASTPLEQGLRRLAEHLGRKDEQEAGDAPR